MAADAAAGRHRWWIHALALAVLAACLWIGWRDVDLHVPQEVVRGSIRSGIRGAVQILVQYLIPAAILVFLGREALRSRRGR